KTIVGNAHNIDHESAGHLGRAHLVTEVFILATNRQLPDNHPINAILQPHFEGTLHINDFARKTLINTGGQVDQYLAPVITEFVRKAAESVLATKLQDQLPLQNMQNRDVDDLPYYPYRDDAKALWGAIRQYTETFLDNYYDSDQDVLADLDIAAGGELGAWWQELTTTQVFENNNMPGFDLGTLTTREELYDLVAYIIFNSSVQHAAVNYPQGDYFTSVALMPGTIARPTPVPGDANQDYYLESLPTKTLALAQTQLMKILTFFRHTQLGKFDESFDDDQVFTATTNFTEDLLQIEAEIDARNEALPEAHRYTYLRPSNVPQSTNL
ncbi:MAG: hypothetical protein HOM11_14020, partial [Methylococcales bacterium]|nr:hypothetical protein [Methylococcales bacterium]